MWTRARSQSADPDGVSTRAIGVEDKARFRWVAAGGLLGAIAASSCCIVPLLLFSLGISGAWIGNLTALEPYKPVFIGFALGFVGYGHWLFYRQPITCNGDAGCAKPLPLRLIRWSLWISTALVLLALFWNEIAPVIAPIMLRL